MSTKPRKSESDNSENVKPTAQDVEEFGEDKKEKETTTVVSGAKTGGLVSSVCCHFIDTFLCQEKARHFLRLQ